MFERILLAVDGSDESREAIRTAIELARSGEGEILAVHVHAKDVGFQVTEDVETRDEAALLLEAAVDIVRKADVPVIGELRASRADKVADELIAAADAYAADCIVVGSRGAGPLAEILIGSVANQVVHRAHCPIIVTRRAAVAA